MTAFSKGRYTYYIYILTNKNRRVLYTGVTGNLHRRLYQHKTKLNPGSFTARYNLEFLVYYEKYDWIHHAIQREKEIKNWSRNKKLELIRSTNPNLEFLNYLFENWI
ncbi:MULTISPECIES: GIY-YIG nuclease family protein [Chryseobacterium]|uniref:GIY-YIG nuclease family protein n=1 Tax=Chryseobacterium TaxID=59732 RepID=UPI0007886BE1|nr:MULTISPECIES: GIY-YIG nuclease family protein [Chryseobacterium]KYH05853.1 endonuclease [Chryseobacterium cucumeris]WFB69351.1 GIY-YIG nuclease family protein [Chryseobacterium sp. WX]